MSTVVNVQTIHHPNGFTLNTLDLSVCFHGDVSLRDSPDCIVSSTLIMKPATTDLLSQPVEVSIRLAEEWAGFLPVVHTVPSHKLNSETLNPVSRSPLVGTWIFIILGCVPFPPTAIQL